VNEAQIVTSQYEIEPLFTSRQAMPQLTM